MASSPPPLGDYYLDPDRTCVRLLGFDADGKERLCGQPAVIHVDWGDACGFICQDHRDDLERWSCRAFHDLGGNCGMPNAVWFDAIWEDKPASWCAIPGDGSDVAEPLRAAAAATTTSEDIEVGVAAASAARRFCATGDRAPLEEWIV